MGESSKMLGRGRVIINLELGERLAPAKGAVSVCQTAERGGGATRRQAQGLQSGGRRRATPCSLDSACPLPQVRRPLSPPPDLTAHTLTLQLPSGNQECFFWTLLALLPKSTLNCSPAAHSQFSSSWGIFSSLAWEALGYLGIRADCSEGAAAGDRPAGIMKATGWLRQ